MPKDDFAKARNKQIANRVRFEIAIGKDRLDSVAIRDFANRDTVSKAISSRSIVKGKKKKTTAFATSPKRQVNDLKVGYVICPKCGIHVKSQNLPKHQHKVHPELSTPVNLHEASTLQLAKPSVKVAPPAHGEALPSIVRCGICRIQVQYANLLAHYILSHRNELPAFRDKSCVVASK